MNSVKIAFVVISLLLIGFVSGFYTHRYLATKKIREVAELRFERGFQARFFNAVQATEDQRTTLQPIVKKYAKKMAASHQDFRGARQAITDSLMAELKPHLNKKQLEQLSEFNRPFRGRRPPNGDRKKDRKKDSRGEKVRQ